MKEQVLKILLGSEGFVSGQSICDELGVSRTAVWKDIAALKNDGYEIESVTNKGYRLVGMPDKLNREAVLYRLTTKYLGRSLEVLPEVDSTNNFLKRLAEQSVVNGMTAVTDKQVAGRGRRGKTWETPEGTNIALSFTLKPEVIPNDASMITIIAALAVAGAVADASGMQPQIKWPNDVLLNGHKICGILTEMSLELTAINYVVVGIGVNVNNESFPDDIKDIASSILMESGRRVDRNELVAGILNYFEKYFAQFLADGNLKELRELYESYLVNIHRTVRIIEKDRERLGEAEGIDDRGGLVVKFPEGTETITGGEVSVRGIYGYV